MSSKSGRIRARIEKWFIGPPRVQTKNGISIGPAVIAQFMLVANKHKSRRQTDRETERQTDRQTYHATRYIGNNGLRFYVLREMRYRNRERIFNNEIPRDVRTTECR